MNTLERWANGRLIELQRTDAMLTELKGASRIAKAHDLAPQPGQFTLDTSQLGGPDVLAGPDLEQEFTKTLFPTADPLTDIQQHDVEHLRQHVISGGDVFVTHNPNDFMTRGRQRELCSCGVWVMLPCELVELLTELYGWD